MATRTEGRAENYLTKIQNAIVMGRYRDFLSKNLGALDRMASKQDHPAEWAIIENGQDKPSTAVNAVYELVCQLTDNRLSAEDKADLDRDVAAEATT